MSTRQKIVAAICSLPMLLTVLPALAGQQLAASDVLKETGLYNSAEEAYLKPKSGAGDTDLLTIVGSLVSQVLGLVGVIFLILMIYGGFLWMTAQGNEETVKKAKNIIIGAVIGAIIVFMAYAITFFVTQTLASRTIKT